jgi:hypothetical protein
VAILEVVVAYYGIHLRVFTLGILNDSRLYVCIYGEILVMNKCGWVSCGGISLWGGASKPWPQVTSLHCLPNCFQREWVIRVGAHWFHQKVKVLTLGLWEVQCWIIVFFFQDFIEKSRIFQKIFYFLSLNFCSLKKVLYKMDFSSFSNC